MKVKHAHANRYRILHDDVNRVLDFYKLEQDMSFRDFLDDYYGRTITVIIPIFGKNGYYQSRQTGLTWMEVNGIAFTDKSMKGQFDYQLSELNQKVYSKREVDAMRELVKLNTLTPKGMQEIRQALMHHHYYMEGRRMAMDGMRMRKRLRNFIKKVNNLGVDK